MLQSICEACAAFVVSILCEFIIPISPCIHTIKLDKLDKDKVPCGGV